MAPAGRKRNASRRRVAEGPGALSRDRLDNDPRWQHYTLDQRWICPFCLAAVRSPQPGRTAVQRAIDRHLAGRCPSYRDGEGEYRCEREIEERLRYENIAHLALTDPAWQVFDHEGYWYSPSTLHKVPSVRIVNRRFDNFTIKNMAAHLAGCHQYRTGTVHPVETVQAARDRGIRVAKLAGNIGQMLRYDIWRQSDPSGFWVCPYCLEHVHSVRVDRQQRWRPLAEAMGAHLIDQCPAFRPDRQDLQPEGRVKQAAAKDVFQEGPPPAGTPTPTPSHRSLSRSNSTRVNTTGTRTRTRTMTAADQSNIPAAIPIDLGSGTQSAPLAKPMGESTDASTPSPADVPPTAPVAKKTPPESPSKAPVATPMQPARSLPTTKSPTGSQASDSGHTAPADSGGEDVANGIFGDPDQALRGSLIDELVNEEVREVTERELEAIGWLDEQGAQAQPPAKEEAAFSWMDDAQHAVDQTKPAAAPTFEDDDDLSKARSVQQGMLRESPKIPGFSFATRYESCSAVSGDFYEFIKLDNGRIGFAQGDVSGHGIQAGLIMSMAKKVLAIYARQTASPGQVLTSVNDALVEDLGGRMFITLTYAVLDPDSRTITWARAGHNPTIVYNRHENSYHEVKPKGMVVGMKGGPLFGKIIEEEQTILRDGDMFVIYTDGITETMNRQKEEYGPERLRELIEQHGDLPVEELLDRIIDSVRSFHGGGDFEDDITLLALSVD